MNVRRNFYDSIVLNIPHSSVEGVFNTKWNDIPNFYNQVLKWTDWYTDYIFQSPNAPILMQRCNKSRFVVDMERLIDDPLEEKGQGIIYTNFEDFTRNVSQDEQIQLMSLYHSYIKGLGELIKDERSIVIDFHSFPSCLADNDICIGFNEDWSKPNQQTLDNIKEIFCSNGFSTEFNTPYSNSITPQKLFCYHSVMIEVNKKAYMDETHLMMKPNIERLKKTMNQIYRYLLYQKA